MSKQAKIVLVAIGVIVLVCAGLVAGGLYWVKNEGTTYLAKTFDDADKVGFEGQEFGLQTDQNGCVKEAVRRAEQGISIAGRLQTNIFLNSCLRTARATLGFCDGVPPKTERIKTAQWAINKCKQLGSLRESCLHLFQEIPEYCEELRTGAADINATPSNGDKESKK